MELNQSVMPTALMLRAALTTVPPTPETISPVTMFSSWSRVGRLIGLVLFSVGGSIGNIFMISSVAIEDRLRKRGNAFLVSLGLADLLVSGIVIPSSAVLILADLSDTFSIVCNCQWFLTLLSCLVSVLTMFVNSVENYVRLCLSIKYYIPVTPCKITLTIISIWVVSFAVVTAETIFGLGPDYCKKLYSGIPEFQLVTGVIMILIPLVLTFICYLYIFARVRELKVHPYFRPTAEFKLDYDLMKTNFLGFIFSILFWIPFGLLLSLTKVEEVSDKSLYGLAWFAMSKSCFLNFLYCLTNSYFRAAYINLFQYCCCKTATFSKRPREPAEPLGDVRVHIIPGYDMQPYTSPQRNRDNDAASNRRVTRGVLKNANRSGNRDSYEL